MVNEIEAKKLTKEELEEIRQDYGFSTNAVTWKNTHGSKLLSHITALEGEAKTKRHYTDSYIKRLHKAEALLKEKEEFIRENHKKIMELGYKIDDMASDVDIRDDRIEEKDGEIERLKKEVKGYEILEGLGWSFKDDRDHWKRVCERAQRNHVDALDENVALKQKVEGLESNITINDLNISALNKCIEHLEQEKADQQALISKIREAAKPIYESRVLRTLEVDALKQACTEGEKEVKFTCGCMGPKSDIRCRYHSACNQEKPPCPDCGGSHISDNRDVGCDGPQQPPRPKGDNPHG